MSSNLTEIDFTLCIPKVEKLILSRWFLIPKLILIVKTNAQHIPIRIIWSYYQEIYIYMQVLESGYWPEDSFLSIQGVVLHVLMLCLWLNH